MNIFKVSPPTTSENVFQAKILKMDNWTDILIRLAERTLALQVKNGPELEEVRASPSYNLTQYLLI